MKSQPSRPPLGLVDQVPSAARWWGAARVNDFCPQTWANRLSVSSRCSGVRVPLGPIQMRGEMKRWRSK
ncbi:hypothetical protein D3C79_898700 [compost metagenome]